MKGGYIMARKAKEPFEKNALSYFAQNPIDKWEVYIDAKSKNEDEKRALKLYAKRSLNIDNMKAYIDAHDNTKEAKDAFKANTWGVQYCKDANGKFELDNDGNKIIALDDNHNPIMKQSIVYAVSYFIETYAPYLKVEAKVKETQFSKLDNWE